MLDNLAGTQGLPSPELIRDLRTLCSLTAQQLSGIADAFGEMPEELTREKLSDTLLARLHSLQGDPEKLTTAVKVALFVWERWSRRGLTKEQVAADLQSLDIGAQQMANVRPLLDVMEAGLGTVARQRAETHALSTGTPRIQSAICVVDARAVFASTAYEEDLTEDQPYFQVARLLPLAFLEIISELNEEETTHTFMLTEENLDELGNILTRAKKRLQVLKERLDVPGEELAEDA